MFDLKSFRKGKKISQKKLADLLGVGQSFISQIETGKDPMPDSLINKLAEIYPNDTLDVFNEANSFKDDNPKNTNRHLDRGGDITIPLEAWDVIKNQSASLKAKDDQINTLISQSKSERDETIQAFKGVISILEKELAKKGEDASYPSHVAIRADTE